MHLCFKGKKKTILKWWKSIQWDPMHTDNKFNFSWNAMPEKWVSISILYLKNKVKLDFFNNIYWKYKVHFILLRINI